MKILVWTLALLLGACASLPVPPTSPEKNHTSQPALLDAWRLDGRFGANSEKDNWAGGLSWQQHGDNYIILLSGPLGGTIRLSGGQGHAELQVSEEEIYTNSNAENLLWQHTGWQFPFSGLRYWLMGLPAPGFAAESVERDEQGRLLKLRQAGWQIDIRRYVDVGNKQLPGKIFLEHPHFDVRLIVDKWEMSG